MKNEQSKTIDYPRMDLDRLVPFLRKLEESGEVVTRSQLAKMFGVSESGGGFSHIVFALKLYGVVDKESQSDFRINEVGKGIVRGDKNSAMQALVRVPIFGDLMNRYPKKVPNKTIVKEYIVDKYKIEKNTANTIARRFVKNMKFLNTLTGEITLPEEIPQSREQNQTDFSTYKTIVDLSVGLKTDKIENTDEVIEKIKNLKLPSISGNELIENFDKLEIEGDYEQKKKILLAVLELIIHSYGK